MAKNIIVCCDGTNNQFGVNNTNVVRLFQCVDTSPSSGQVAFYDPGVGTLAAPGWHTQLAQKASKLTDLAFATGIMSKVEQVIRFLIANYQPGDQVFLFGFSRGAYTVRMAAGWLRKCGLPTCGNEAIIPSFKNMYLRRGNDALHKEFKATFGQSCPVRLLGLWDTVSSVGVVWDPESFDFTFENEDVSFIRHAMALDERRAFFRTNRWSDTAATIEDGKPVLKQLFFPGVHSDVGGGYQEGELWKEPLRWMANEAAALGVRLNAAKLAEILSASGSPWYVSPQHDSQTLGWKAASILFKKHKELENGVWVDRYSRAVPKDRKVRLGEHLHRSVIERWMAMPSYRPRNLDNSIMERLASQLSPADESLAYL